MQRRTFLRLARMFPFLTEQHPGHYFINVHAKPGARSSTFAGPLSAQNGELDLRIAAPAVEGQANAELIRFLDEVVQQGLRELRSDPTGYLEGTSHARVVAAEAAAAAVAASQHATSGTSDNIDKKGKKKGGKMRETTSSISGRQMKKSDGGKAFSPTHAASSAVFPDGVEVTLVRGGTSREKKVLILFPGTRAQLIAVLEKASQS